MDKIIKIMRGSQKTVIKEEGVQQKSLATASKLAFPRPPRIRSHPEIDIVR